MSINWNKFDKIYCIHFLPYKEREEFLIKELKRIGIYESDNFEFYETVPNKYYDYLLLYQNDNYENDIYNVKYNCSNINGNNCYMDLSLVNYTNIKLTIDSYNLLKLCQTYKFKRVLILEDDNSYLKNLDMYADYINNIPEDYDIINLDPYIFPLNPADKKSIDHILNISKDNDINGYFYDCTYEPTFNCSNVIFSQNAINYIIEKQQEFLKPFDYYTWNIGDSGLKRCNSNRNLSIQNLYDKRQNTYQTLDTKYKFQNINRSEYETRLDNV